MRRRLLRTAALATIAASVALPFARRRLGVSHRATMMTMVAAPFALAVVTPRTRTRDAGIFFLQMWAYLVAHELPYDDPAALRRRLKVRYPIDADRLIGGGVLPNTRLQALLGSGEEGTTRLQLALTWVHWLWFLEPYAALLFVLLRRPQQFPRAARLMAGTFDSGAVAYALVPTAPPWWAAENGYTGPDEVRRIMIDVGIEVWGEETWDKLYDFLGGNPWAAMPSLHFGTSLQAALVLREAGPLPGALGSAYAGALGFALVYLGEHYVTDVLAGGALALAVRGADRNLAPAGAVVSRALQHLEAKAA